ncbi:MAG: hypothetical protein EAY72_04440 [Bacteroidetes bacterium]|nr:MAG: hypothetical protein EAY72_04440 [Bacteroidota bacterium]
MVHKRLLFLHRVIFLANLAFVGCVTLQNSTWLNALPQFIKGGVVLLGWVMAPILSVVGFIYLLWCLYQGSLGQRHWLYFVNVLMAVAQVYILFIL